MKLSSETKARMWPEIYESVAPICVGVAMGALATKLIGADIIYYAATGCALTFGFLQWKTGFRALKNRIADREDAMRWCGLYPAPGAATPADIKRLKDAGHKIYAVKLYRELHPETDLRAAVAAVEAL